MVPVSHPIERIFNDGGTPDEILTRLVPAFCEALECDRCVLFPRNPKTTKWAMSHSWQTQPEYALDRPFRAWSLPAENEAELDPMYAQALESAEVLFIEDIFTAPQDVVNAAFEHESYGNRALAHVPIYDGVDYYGLLEPCTVDKPHVWTPARRRLVRRTQAWIAPVVSAYVVEHGQ